MLDELSEDEFEEDGLNRARPSPETVQAPIAVPDVKLAEMWLAEWGESVRRLISTFAGIKFAFNDKLWRVNTPMWVYMTAMILVRGPKQFLVMETHMTENYAVA